MLKKVWVSFFLLLAGLLVNEATAGPRYVNISIDELPAYITVKVLKLGDDVHPWYGFSTRVDLKDTAASPMASWSAKLALINKEGNYTLTAPLQRAKTSEGVAFWVTLDLGFMKGAVIQLRDNNNFIVYQIKLLVPKGMLKNH